ncbi:response regulator [Melioribacter sp. OK-6-Me]|uniref:response regulator n=1 Tax=unclassified Melioribacter TaxID=2627329 RepID=UPI003ED8D9E4
MTTFFDNKVRILVIDDSDIIRNVVKNFLKEYNIEVIMSSDGLEGIQKAIEYKPKLIFLDIMMPNLDGLRMLKVIKILDDLKNIPVIVISGHTDKKNVIEAVESGAVNVISKPLTKSVLIKSIKEALGDDFFSELRNQKLLSNEEKKEIKETIKKLFISNLPSKIEAIKDALVSEKRELLMTIIHELKGSSGTVGFRNLSRICAEIEGKISDNNNDWRTIENSIENLFNEIEVLEILNSK